MATSAVEANITAVCAIAEFLKPSLQPSGSIIVIVDAEGRYCARLIAHLRLSEKSLQMFLLFLRLCLLSIRLLFCFLKWQLHFNKPKPL
jgi:hypothetical protein